MYRFILGINSFWLLFPLYTNLDFNLICIHTIFTSFISTLYWFSNYNRLLHNIDRINAISYFFHLLYNDLNPNIILYLFVILFYGISHILHHNNKQVESLFAHLTFRKCGLCIVYLQLSQKPENLYIIMLLYYFHLFYLFLVDQHIILRSIELFIYKFLIIYVSSNVYPILR